MNERRRIRIKLNRILFLSFFKIKLLRIKNAQETNPNKGDKVRFSKTLHLFLSKNCKTKYKMKLI